jgi:RNA polymerase sigma-70 factor (ECF subfamily)
LGEEKVKPIEPSISLYIMYKPKGGPPKLKKEDELIKRIREGDKDAFGHLVKDLLSSAYQTAFLILRSKEHAEDALQNALEGAYISIMKNSDMTHFKPWFYRVVYSKSIDLYRKNNRHGVTELDDYHQQEGDGGFNSAQQLSSSRRRTNRKCWLVSWN